MKITINRSLLYRFVGNHFGSERVYRNFVDAIASRYRQSMESDSTLFGETLMNEQPGAVVAITSNPMTAVICRLVYLQTYGDAQVPIYVATCSEDLTVEHIAALKGRNCIFMPTARQYGQWSRTVIDCRSLLGNRVKVDNLMILLNSAMPEKVQPDTDFQFVAVQPFSIAKYQYNNDTFEFINQLGGFGAACKEQEINNEI